MNTCEAEILLKIKNQGNLSQRQLATLTGYSLGMINKSLRKLQSEKYLDSAFNLLPKGNDLIETSRPERAIILAAGYGLRMIPINTEQSKGMLTIDGEKLVERVIKQLKEKGIDDITIVVGFLKESYDYLIDKYDVKLVFNKEYSSKNNLFSLNCVKNLLGNSYIIPCDIWCKNNPFSSEELYSWYSITDEIKETSSVRINRQLQLDFNPSFKNGNKMLGISYLTKEDGDLLKSNIETLISDSRSYLFFWEEALFQYKNIKVYARLINSDSAIEIDSYEQLRDFDSSSKELKSEALDIIAETLKCYVSDIHQIQTLKKGMTNRSFIFQVRNQKYIMRIPGEGTDLLVNRRNEAAVYNAIKSHNICDELFYINPENGYKLTKFIPNSRVCDPENPEDLKKCMAKLRSFHDLQLEVSHEFNLFDQIDFYQSLWKEEKSIFADYELTKEHVLELKNYIQKMNPKKVLTHIDAVPDNFLFSENEGKEEIQLIDWEYAGMQDPHVDIAMFCIYSLYDDKSKIDRLIDFYFTEGCTPENRTKIYCYVAICGLLWSNWCEYKRHLGVEFGEYSLKQYRYAKDYYKIAMNEIQKMEKENA